MGSWDTMKWDGMGSWDGTRYEGVGWDGIQCDGIMGYSEID